MAALTCFILYWVVLIWIFATYGVIAGLLAMILMALLDIAASKDK